MTEQDRVAAETDNVRTLQTPAKTNAEAALEVLERFVAMVKEGKVVAVAIAGVRADRVSSTWGWSSSDCAPAVVGAVAGMQTLMILDSHMQARAMPK